MKLFLRLMLVGFFSTAFAIQAQDTGAIAESPADPGWTAFVSGMTKMHTATAALGPSGNNDLDFVQLMMPHHQAAIDMAKAELNFGSDPQMRRMAQEIITDQQSEIELMQLWLKRHGSAHQARPASR